MNLLNHLESHLCYTALVRWQFCRRAFAWIPKKFYWRGLMGSSANTITAYNIIGRLDRDGSHCRYTLGTIVRVTVIFLFNYWLNFGEFVCRPISINPFSRSRCRRLIHKPCFGVRLRAYWYFIVVCNEIPAKRAKYSCTDVVLGLVLQCSCSSCTCNVHWTSSLPVRRSVSLVWGLGRTSL